MWACGPDPAQARREARSAEHCQGCQYSWPLGVALSLVSASKAALPLCEARQAQGAVICTGGMLKPTAGGATGISGGEQELSTKGSYQSLCVVGTLRRRSFGLNSQRETSQGSHLEHLRPSRRRPEQGNALGGSVL